MTPSNTTAPLSSLALLCSEDIFQTTARNCSTESSAFLRHASLSSEPFVEWGGAIHDDDDDDDDDDAADQELSCLLSKEQETQIVGHGNLARGEAVSWILKVSDCCSFSAVTAVLAVNYLDRFLCSLQSRSDSEKHQPWMNQLAAVACLSLAAKVEETRVPLLLDLQLMKDSEYVFESKTIQRMEILVLSALEWKMNPVTPFSFLDYIARRLPLKDNLCREFLRRCECRILSVISDFRFMLYPPSAVAAAAMLSGTSGPNPFVAMEDQLASLLGSNKSKVEECCKLMQVAAARSDNFHSMSNKRRSRSLPRSPKGVVDVSFSPDASTDLCTIPIVVVSPASVSSSPQPLSKKIKPQSPAQIPN